MTGADLIPVISSSLIYATQLSFVEDAPGTRSILEKLDVLLRYAERPGKDVRLAEEWSVLAAYLELHRIQAPDRFSYEIQDIGSLPSEFIPRCRLLDGLDRAFRKVWQESRGTFAFTLCLSSESPPDVELVAEAGGRTVRTAL